MFTRYLLIEPQYADSPVDVFCSITIGSGRFRGNIHIFPDFSMIESVAQALVNESLDKETPDDSELVSQGPISDLRLSVLPRPNERVLRAAIWQLGLDDGAPFALEAKFSLTHAEARELSNELLTWLRQPRFVVSWTSSRAA